MELKELQKEVKELIADFQIRLYVKNKYKNIEWSNAEQLQAILTGFGYSTQRRKY